MLENPQTLINIKNISCSNLENSEQLPDAIYIPFLNRYNNLNQLLSSLRWFKGNITILISPENDTTKIDIAKNYQVDFINCSDFEVTEKIKQLNSFKNTCLYINGIKDWDLPIKRNFALLHAIKHSFKNILLIDDDIEGITQKIINKGVAALESDNIVGCLVQGFPDTSVIGHIEQKYGESHFPFLSGNFLFICPNKTEGFFPPIYNEDWLFMIPSIIQNKVSIIDVIYQKSYNPFNDISRIKLQEFGEIIAEGLFELVSRARFDDRFSTKFWNRYIEYRRSYVSDLLDEADVEFIPLIEESLRISKEIKAKQCIAFVKEWEADIIAFTKIRNYEA